MAMFKKSADVVDLTILQKRGLLKKIEKEPTTNHDSEGYADLTKQTPLPQQPVNQFDFLDSLAGASSSASTLASNSTGSPNIEIQNLNVKLDDLEYKMERLIERLAAIEAKISNR